MTSRSDVRYRPVIVGPLNLIPAICSVVSKIGVEAYPALNGPPECVSAISLDGELSRKLTKIGRNCDTIDCPNAQMLEINNIWWVRCESDYPRLPRYPSVPTSFPRLYG